MACVLVTSAEKKDFWTVQGVRSFPETVFTSYKNLSLYEALPFLKTNIGIGIGIGIGLFKMIGDHKNDRINTYK